MVDYWNSSCLNGRMDLFFDYEKEEKEINNLVIRVTSPELRIADTLLLFFSNLVSKGSGEI